MNILVILKQNVKKLDTKSLIYLVLELIYAHVYQSNPDRNNFKLVKTHHLR
jgi:hypothetical protein